MRKGLSSIVERKWARVVAFGEKRYFDIRVATGASDISEGKQTYSFPLLEGLQYDTTLLSMTQSALRRVAVKLVS